MSQKRIELCWHSLAVDTENMYSLYVRVYVCVYLCMYVCMLVCRVPVSLQCVLCYYIAATNGSSGLVIVTFVFWSFSLNCKILTASTLDNWRRPHRTPSYYVDEDYPAEPEIQ